MRFVKPDVVATHFHLRDGDRVADFGAGTGYFLKTLSGAVGNDGRVYAMEIQRNLVEELGNVKQRERLPNVEPVWCDLEAPRGTKLADGILDAGIMVNTLFQIEDKATALAEVARVLRPGAKFFVIDWSESFGGLGPRQDDVISKEDTRAAAESAGFRFDREFPAGEHHYGLAFRKA